MPLDDFLRDRQPHAVPLVLLPRVQALEDLEYPLLELRFEADPIILYGEYPPWRILSLIRMPGRHVNHGTAAATELQCISDQILKHLSQLYRIGHHPRQRLAMNRRACFVDGYLQIGQCRLHALAGINQDQRLLSPTNP